nr:putative RNA-directed DNA polymerase [Tanacetum cinerariifolium]
MESEISWNELSLSHLDPRTKQCELEVQKIIHLQDLANKLPDAFIDRKRVTKSHIPVVNALVKICVHEGQPTIGSESKACLKRGRPVGSKDKNPRKKKGANNQDGILEVKETPERSLEETLDIRVLKKPRVPENDEISINYSMSTKVWNRNEIGVDDIFAYNVALEVIKMMRIKSQRYKWVFMRKRNEKNDITRYKARLEAQGFSQRPGIDYEETYSPVVDATTFQYLISLVIQEGIDLRLMDVVTAYLYGSLDTEIYMKLPEGYKMPESSEKNSREQYAIKLNKSLYGLKQSRRMWYNRLIIMSNLEFLALDITDKNDLSWVLDAEIHLNANGIEDMINEGNKTSVQDKAKAMIFLPEQNNELLTKNYETRATGTAPLPEANVATFKNQNGSHGRGRGSDRRRGRGFGRRIYHGVQFKNTSGHNKWQDKGKTNEKGKDVEANFVYDNENVDSPDGHGDHRTGSEYVIISVYVDDLNIIGTPGKLPKAMKCLKKEFEMKDLGKTKFYLGLQIEHLNDGILVHQEAYTKRVLKRFYMDKSHSLSTPMVVRSLDVEKDPFRPSKDDEDILGPEQDIAHVLLGGIGMGSNKYFDIFKQTIATTSSNHVEILAIHEAIRVCVWLRNVIVPIGESCGVHARNEGPSILHEDNAACIAQLNEGFIKGDRTKHISLKFFFTHGMQKNGYIIVQKIRSSDNLANLFTKALSTSTFKKLVYGIGMQRLSELK